MYRKLSDAALAAILEAGVDEFARCGYQPASVANVAKGAGVSVGVIYKYFGNKKSLFLACVRHSLKLLDETLSSALNGSGSVEEAVRRLVEGLIVAARQHGNYNVLYNEITSGSCRAFAAELAQEIEAKTAAAYAQLFARARQEGVLCGDLSPEHFAFFFDNLLMMMQFSYSCDYYQHRMRLFCGPELTQDTRMAGELTRFLLGAMKGEGEWNTSSPTTLGRLE